jgi:hypothetical protein
MTARRTRRASPKWRSPPSSATNWRSPRRRSPNWCGWRANWRRFRPAAGCRVGGGRRRRRAAPVAPGDHRRRAGRPPRRRRLAHAGRPHAAALRFLDAAGPGRALARPGDAPHLVDLGAHDPGEHGQHGRPAGCTLRGQDPLVQTRLRPRLSQRGRAALRLHPRLRHAGGDDRERADPPRCAPARRRQVAAGPRPASPALVLGSGRRLGAQRRPLRGRFPADRPLGGRVHGARPGFCHRRDLLAEARDVWYARILTYIGYHTNATSLSMSALAQMESFLAKHGGDAGWRTRWPAGCRASSPRRSRRTCGRWRRRCARRGWTAGSPNCRGRRP